MFMTEHKIAVIAGDGIGREVMPEGVRVMEAAAARHARAYCLAALMSALASMPSV